MAYNNSSEAIETLAAEIAENVYMDIAKWHLYLGDAKLHTPLAEQLYPLLINQTLNEEAVLSVLQSTTIKLGGGRYELPLVELLPLQCQMRLMDILEEYQKKL
ncbi:MAG: DUF3181 family protein [Cyanobacteria bacterium P01_H01_bin.119]